MVVILEYFFVLMVDIVVELSLMSFLGFFILFLKDFELIFVLEFIRRERVLVLKVDFFDVLRSYIFRGKMDDIR